MVLSIEVSGKLKFTLFEQVTLIVVMVSAPRSPSCNKSGTSSGHKMLKFERDGL